MSILIISLLVLLSLIIQTTLVPYISIFGVTANLLIIIFASISLLKGKPYSSLVGLVIGLLQDILFSSIIGINALIYFIIGYLIDSSKARVNIKDPMSCLGLTLIVTIAYNLMFYIFISLLSYEVSILEFIKNKLIIELVLNSILSIPVYSLVSKLFNTPTIEFNRN